ncbi:uncharacterized protein [Ptychodera flava]|uniref:uncharacterized protein n=1 Tax=Ptychodera flava TaxID=63121 RepID=UPI00396A7022
MNVKRAVETLSEEVAEDMKISSYGRSETWLTRQYIHNCTTYFSVMNDVEEDHQSLKKLVKVLLFFKNWFSILKHHEKDRASTKTDYWKQFISLQTYRDVLRSIRGFIALSGYLKINHPEIKFVPRTTNQDDVENYFSLQRARLTGGEPTVEQYMDGNSTLTTSFLLKAEENDLVEQFGSYNKAVLPNFVSIPLRRKVTPVDSESAPTQDLWSTSDVLTENLQKPSFQHIGTFQSKAKEFQLIRHAQQTIKIILLKMPKIEIQYTHRILSLMTEKTNQQTLLDFLQHLDCTLRTKYYNTPSWTPSTYMTSVECLRKEKAVRDHWTKLLESVNLTPASKIQQEQSIQLLGNFVKKFARRRCVTYLATDGLNPTVKTTAVRKLLKEYSEDVQAPHTNDVCFNCGVKGHWARQCRAKAKHDEEWLKHQNCYFCGEAGHLKKSCPKLNIRFSENGTPAAEVLKLPEVNLDNRIESMSDNQQINGDRKDSRYFRQCSSEWFEVRRGLITGSKAATALGWRGKKEMDDLYRSLRNHDDTQLQPNKAMKWGTMCEDSGVVTYIHYLNITKFVKTGFWVFEDNEKCKWLGASPDGIVNNKIVIEVKCPFSNGKLFPYKNIPINYIPQIQLEILVTNTDECHFVCWTPKKTLIYRIKRDNEFIALLLTNLKKFWDCAQSGNPVILTEQTKILKLKAKEIINKSELLISAPSFKSNDISKHKFFDDFCKHDDLKTNTDILKTASSHVSQYYQSYSYNSGGVSNSCFIDTFLECMYNVVKRKLSAFENISNQSEIMSTFMKSLDLRSRNMFHASKMSMWHYLCNHTTDGLMLFPIGNMAAIGTIFDKFYQNMKENEKQMFFLKTPTYLINVQLFKHTTNST